MKTGNRPSAPTCSLGRLQARSMDTEAVKSEAWKNDRILVICADDPRIGWIEKQVIEQLGNKLFGRG